MVDMAAERPTTSPTPSGLRWVADVLLGSVPDDDVVVGPDVPAGYREVVAFTPFPGPASPYALLPLDRKAAAETLRRIGNPSAKLKRLATSTLALGASSGVPQRIRGTRVRFSVPSGWDGEDLLTHLREVLGDEGLEIGVILGRDRPNRKPVLKVMDRDGRAIAFAKLGWNALSAELVRHEADVLTALATPDRRPRSFDVPQVLHRGEWSGSSLLIVSAAPPEGWLRDGPPEDAPADAGRELAGMDGDEGLLGETEYWRDARARIGDADPTGPSGETLLRAADEIEQRWADRRVALGRWHGDWIPWNMTVVDGRPFVWDWERSATGVPAGIDLAHFEFDVRAKVRGETPDTAVRECLRRAPRSLEKLGLPTDLGPLVHRLHLIEMCLRFEEARARGVVVEDAIYRPALDELLTGAP
jgi:hypothetical protein